MSEYNELFLEPKTTQYGSHMVMTNVSKPNKKKYINIDTKFRDEYNYLSTSNYNLTLPERITDVKTMTVTNVEIPILFYNISSSLGNNSFKITNLSSNNTNTLIIIPDGQYTSNTLVTAINRLTGNLTFDISGNYTQFYTTADSFTVDFTVNDQNMKDNYNFRYKLGWIMGFRKTSYYVTTSHSDNTATSTINGYTVTISEKTIDLNGPRYLYLAIEEFGKGNQKSFISPIATAFINKNIIARISLDNTRYPFGSIFPTNRMYGSLLTDTRSYTGKIDLMKLNIQLLSETGNPISLNDYDFSFCLEVEHE